MIEEQELYHDSQAHTAVLGVHRRNRDPRELVSLGVCSAHVGREVHHIAPKPSRLELHRHNPCVCLSAVTLTDMPCTRRQVA